MQLLSDLRRGFNDLFEKVNRATGGVLGILRLAWEDYTANGGQRDAAALSFYLLFSFFPLLLVFVVTLSFILNLESTVAFTRTVGFISRAVPVSRDFIRRNLQAVLDRRGPISLLGVIGAVWSASSAFRVLSQNINEAWRHVSPRSFIRKRLIGIAMVGAIVLVLLLLSLISATLTTILPTRILLFGDVILHETPLWPVVTRLFSLLFSALMFFAIYRWVPSWSPSWESAAWSACLMAILWELAKLLFAAYVSSGLARYEVVYGSLGTVAALLFWAYISANIALFGAHLTAAIERRRRLP